MVTSFPVSCVKFSNRPAGKLEPSHREPVIMLEFDAPSPGLEIGPDPPYTVIGLRIPLKLNIFIKSSADKRVMVSTAELTVSKKGGSGLVLFYQDKNNKVKEVQAPTKDFDSFKFKVRGNIRHLSLQTDSEQAYVKKVCVSTK
jgi:hypothetical protein